VCYTMIAYPLIVLGHYIDVNILGKINTLFTFEPNMSQYTQGPRSIGLNSTETREVELSHILVALPVFVIIQSLFLLYSVVFKRFAFLKTVVLVTLMFLCGFYFNVYTAMLMLQDAQPTVLPHAGVEIMYRDGQENYDQFKIYEAIPYYSITVTNGSNNFRFYVNKWKAILPPNMAWITKLCFISLLMFMYTITFFRLRENQV
jgi:hypothetical protein